MLFFVNIPHKCTDRELREFVESRGLETRSVRIIRDLVAGVPSAFGYVALKDETRTREAISILNGKKMRNQTVMVKEWTSHLSAVHTAVYGTDRNIA